MIKIEPYLCSKLIKAHESALEEAEQELSEKQKKQQAALALRLAKIRKEKIQKQSFNQNEQLTR